MTSSATKTKTVKPTFGKLYYQGQHAFFLHRIADLKDCTDPVGAALAVAKRKKLKVLGYKVLGSGNPVIRELVLGEDKKLRAEWVPAKLETKTGKDGKVTSKWVKADAAERIILVKCMAPRKAA